MERSNSEKITLGEKLKLARKSAGLTQDQLAEKLLVSRQAVTKWEAEAGDIYGEKKKIAVNRFYHSSDNWDIGNTVIYWIIS